MNKAELINAVMAELNEAAIKAGKDEAPKIKASEVKTIVDHTVDTITAALAEGEDVRLGGGFGIFSVQHRDERQGRNPKTGQRMTIPACKVVKFKPGKTLREIVNG